MTMYLLVAIGLKGRLASRSPRPAWPKSGCPPAPPCSSAPSSRLGPIPCSGTPGDSDPPTPPLSPPQFSTVSAVTFIAATNYLKSINQPYEPYATAFLAVMESPAILVGVVLGKLGLNSGTSLNFASLRTAMHEALFGRSIFSSRRLPDRRRAVRKARHGEGRTVLRHSIPRRARLVPPGNGNRRVGSTLETFAKWVLSSWALEFSSRWCMALWVFGLGTSLA